MDDEKLEEKKEEKKIEIVSGNGSDLNISPVYDNISISKPHTKKPKNIIVPNEKKNSKKN